ncbi:hypothetical protein AB0A05_27220 [Streptomyces sp. NPDC046374]|uniref:hypothetical protein n=1 Tax=Streptomyces sp. NPDC046374 TaxID=3154917 RepID=UPI0033D452BB
MKVQRGRTGERPGLKDEWRALWEVAHNVIGPDGDVDETKEIVQQLDANPLTGSRTIEMSAFARIRQTPEMPDVDVIADRSGVIGYVDSTQAGEDGDYVRVHGLRCSACGSAEVEVRSRAWAVCGGCDLGQGADATQLCSAHCTECLEQGT